MDRRLLVCLALLALSACATPPVSLSGSFAEISVSQARQGDHLEQRVRWGGEIVSTTPGKTDTCFEVASRPLDREARPRRTDESDGRFIACAAGFYDPAVYSPGRQITVVGTIKPSTTGKIGEYEYHFPRVAAATVHLWARRETPTVIYYDNPWPNPFWGPWPYYWGPWP